MVGKILHPLWIAIICHQKLLENCRGEIRKTRRRQHNITSYHHHLPHEVRDVLHFGGSDVIPVGEWRPEDQLPLRWARLLDGTRTRASNYCQQDGTC